jgi:transcriptional regulator with XRE-family HTH domain
MKLEQYLHEKEIKPVAFAASIDVAPSTITRILRGERTPRLDLIAKIRAATGGQVTADDFMPVEEDAA